VNAPGLAHDWVDANQRVLVAEFARLNALIAGQANAVNGEDGPEAFRRACDQARGAMAAPAAIDLIADRFALSPFECDLLLVAAGVEMDTAIAVSCSLAGGRGAALTPGLALVALPDSHWSAFTPARPLRRWRLVEPEDGPSLVQARWRIDERVLHYLAGVNGLDARLRPMLRSIDPPELLAKAQHGTAETILRALTGLRSARAPVIQLWGEDAHGQHDVAAHVAERLGLTLYAVSAADLPTTPQDVETLATLWDRELVLSEVALILDSNDESAGRPAIRRLLEQTGGLVFVSTREPLDFDRDDLRLRVDKPDPSDQRDLWLRVLGDTESAQPLADAGAAFRLSARDVRRAGARVLHEKVGAIRAQAQREHCRTLACQRLEGLAQRITPAAGWDDLILPAAQVQALRQIASQVRHRATVHDRWGFAARGTRGLGLVVLLAGDSGTGKTMAAEVLARELDLALLRIDLASVVSKYIGETEKHLARIFDAGEDGGAILLFDEADALFGKRSEVKDSHDRYANIEVSYLLQRMEAYRGLALLTTNQKSALDPAFQRRLRQIINFPFPDAEQRAQIWRGAFPAATPTEGLDMDKLGRLQVSGGQIRNIAVNAAFHAAEEGVPVRMAHLLEAARAEAAKRDRSISDSETRGWL
jgi:ATPase family associated with various cellular activities (AAA)